jgi:hypothetical protein
VIRIEVQTNANRNLQNKVVILIPQASRVARDEFATRLDFITCRYRNPQFLPRSATRGDAGSQGSEQSPSASSGDENSAQSLFSRSAQTRGGLEATAASHASPSNSKSIIATGWRGPLRRERRF